MSDEIYLDELPVRELAGDCVVLRPLEEGDFAPLYAVIDSSRDFLSQFLPWPGECSSVEDVASRAESWEMQAQMGNGACWGIFEKTDAGLAVAGCIVVGWVRWAHRSAELNYWLGKDFTGRGLATEALRLVSRELFSLGLNRLEISASVNNEKSCALACRCGFVEEGVSRDFERINGIFVDHRRFARLARDPESGL